MSDHRPRPEPAAAELPMLRSWLAFHRSTLRAKCANLDQAQLAQQLPPGALTLGGLLKHLACVEDWWFSAMFLGRDEAEPWRGVDWKPDPDWDLNSAAADTPEELFRLFDEACASSDEIVDRLDDLDQLSARANHHYGEAVSLRWILVHMIEEYARHNGHADLIRESIDGQVGA